MQWITFPLHPETPESGLTLEELFAGRGKDIPAILDRLKQAADQAGLPFGRRTHTFNSRRAQELGKWAEEQGRGDEFHLAAFKIYFVDGLNIAQMDTLQDLASSVGLDPAQARLVLEQGLYKEAVDRDWAYSRRMGVSVVPTFMADGRGVAGAQPYSQLAQLARLAGAVQKSV